MEKFETVPEFEKRTGKPINPYQAVYSRRSPNDCWHVETFFSASRPDSYCASLGTPEIIVANTDKCPRLPNGRSINAKFNT
jgi:hypothetical protein